MYSSTERAFKFSVILHLVVFALIALVAWINRLTEKLPKPHVFTLVSSPPSQEVPLTPVETAEPSQIEFPQPKQPEPIPQVEPPPIPPKPKAVEKPKPEPSPPKTLSYEEFIQQQGQPKVQSPSRRPKPVNIPRIQTDDIVRDLVKTNTASTPSPDELNRYISTLRDKISQHWSKPRNLGGQDIEVEVEFTVLPSGRITDVRILNPSGITDFDTSVNTAFARLQNAGVPPGRVARRFSLTLRMKDLNN